MLHCNHLVSQVPHVLFIHPIYEQYYFFYICSTLPDIWDVTFVLKMSNSKRRNLDITNFFQNIYLYLYPIKILSYLLGKLYFCIVLYRPPQSMSTQLLSPLQIRIKIPVLKIKIVAIQNTWVLFHPVMVLVSIHMNTSYRQMLKWRGKRRRWRLSLFCYLMGCLNLLDHRKEPGIL